MKKHTLILFFVLLASHLSAQISITTLGTPYLEDFNSLGNNAITTVPSGWKFGTGASPTYANVSNYTATSEAAGTTGGNVITQSSNGGTYNFGNGQNGTSTDRAIGFIASAGYSGQRHIMLQMINNTCSTISQLDVTFKYEKYRNGVLSYDWNLFGSTNGTTWTAIASGDKNYPADGENITVHNPPLSNSTTVSITGLNVTGAASYYLRWTYRDASLTYQNAMALGIDDFSVTASGSACIAPAIPTVQASALSISAINSSSMTLNWARGNGSRCLVIARQGSAVATNPTLGTSYADNSIFGLGNAIGAGFAVYVGYGTSVTVTGLNPSTQYYFKVYEFNSNCTCAAYITGGSAPVANATTCVATPTVQSSALSFSAISASQMQLDWVRGNGVNCIVVAKAGSAVTTAPVFGNSYTANAAFGTGSTTAAGEYVVYSGSANTVTVTSLSFNTNYYYAVYEFSGSGACTNYYTVAPLTGNAATLCTEPTTQVAFASYSAASATIVLNLTPGNGSKRIIVGSTTAITAAELPIDGSSYSASSNFGSGSAIGAGFVLLNSTGNSVTVSGLSPSTIYYFASFEYCSAADDYLTSVYPTQTIVTTPGCGSPTIAATGINFTSILDVSMTINWTNGDATNRLVVVSTLPINGSDVPTNGSVYTANTLFGSGSMIGSSFVVYAGTGSSVNITGLTGNTNYYTAVFEFNSCPATNYLTSIYPTDFETSSCAASSFAFQGFETAGMTWAGTFSSSSTTGGSDTPANQRILTGTKSFQNAGVSGTITLNAVPTTAYVNKKITIRVSSTGVTGGQGMDAADNIKFFVALNGAAFAGTPDIKLSGGANAIWPYSANLTASTIVGTSISIAAPQGGLSNNNFSTIILYIPDGATQVALKIIATSDSPNEVWNIDDINLSGCPGSTAVVPTQFSFTNMPKGCFIPNQNLMLAVSATNGNNEIDDTYTGTVTLTVTNGPGNLTGTLSAVAVSGVAVFNAFALDLDGTYNLTASDGTISGLSSDIIISAACATVCAKIKSLFVDACISGSEGREEFFTFITGSDPLPLSQLKIKFPNGSTYCNSGCATQIWKTNAARVAQYNTTAGCAGLFVEANPIPANAQVIVFTGANPSYSFNFSAECGTGPIYAVFANNSSPTGRFANYHPSCTTRTLEATFGTCTDQASYERCLLNPGDGAFVDYDFGTTLYKSEGCTPITALPIELSSFTAELKGAAVAVNWSTASEINNNYFTVLRSGDAVNFEELKRIKGAGNSSNTLSYEIVDNSPMNGMNYYQLKQTDFDGTTSLSDIVAVKVSGKSIAFEQLLQNIEANTLEARIQSAQNENVLIEIYDISGRVIFSKEIVSNEDKTSISLSTAPYSKGIYLLKASNGLESVVRKLKF
ncbi:MAG: T9SS type A sorting domain-containing protein [Bacteroidetes bacterium]|nr:T9SS type A sorting domain-containing protein [Bacteroidota bacterium]